MKSGALMTRVQADLTLVLVAFIWGTAFIAQKGGNEHLGPITFVGNRFLLSSLVIAPVAFFESKAAAQPCKRQDLILACIISCCLFCGSTLQQIGLLSTTATNAGFLTALYVVMVPIVAWFTLRQSPRPIVMVAGVISVAGAWLLAGHGQMQKWAAGDVLMLVADIAWACHITLITVFMRRANRPFFLCFVQYSISAACGISAGLCFETVTKEAILAALPTVAYAGVLSGGVAYSLQVVAQRYTPAAEAALIVSLESVFAALAGAVFLKERFDLPALSGCALILLSVILVEIGPLVRHFQRG